MYVCDLWGMPQVDVYGLPLQILRVNNNTVIIILIFTIIIPFTFHNNNITVLKNKCKMDQSIVFSIYRLRSLCNVYYLCGIVKINALPHDCYTSFFSVRLRSLAINHVYNIHLCGIVKCPPSRPLYEFLFGDEAGLRQYYY